MFNSFIVVTTFYIILFLSIEGKSDCPVPTSCPTDEHLNPQNGKCISNNTGVVFSDKECEKWGECGFCMSNSLFFKSVSLCESCLSTNIIRTDDANSNGCYPSRCEKYKPVCELAPDLLQQTGVCNTLCDCLRQQKEQIKVESKNISNVECGLVSFTNPNYKIVGGMEAHHGSYPWMVSLRHGLVPSHRCGGSLINKRMIITAAHCIIGNRTLYSGWVGKHHRYKEDHSELRVNFSRIFVHPKFKRRTMENDIAILIIDKEIEYTNYIRPVCLCSKALHENLEITVTGWGSTKSKISNNGMREVTIPLIAPVPCNSTGYKTYKKIKAGMFCAGLDGGGKDACQGDSGGPAVRSIDDVYELVGVVSWGFGCARYRSPGVYSNVCYHRRWIEAHAKRLGIE